jgi:hypothetical protein
VQEKRATGMLTVTTQINTEIEQRNRKTITTATTSPMVLMAVATYLQLAKVFQSTLTIAHMSAHRAMDIKALEPLRMKYTSYENNVNTYLFDRSFYGKDEC